MIRLISHIALSALLLLSATGLTINMHYCHDQLIDLAILAPAESCCESGLHENHGNSNESICNSGHCVDESVGFESTNDYVVSAQSFNFENAQSIDLLFSTTLIVDNLSAAEAESATLINFKKPPNPQEVVLSQIQSFLI